MTSRGQDKVMLSRPPRTVNASDWPLFGQKRNVRSSRTGIALFPARPRLYIDSVSLQVYADRAWEFSWHWGDYICLSRPLCTACPGAGTAYEAIQVTVRNEG